MVAGTCLLRVCSLDQLPSSNASNALENSCQAAQWTASVSIPVAAGSSDSVNIKTCVAFSRSICEIMYCVPKNIRSQPPRRLM